MHPRVPAVAIVLLLAGACGPADGPDAEAGTGEGAGEGAGLDAATPGILDRDFGGVGVAGETWIDGAITGEGAPGTLAARLTRSYPAFGARIDGAVLEIRLPGPPGVDLSLRRDTAAQTIPGAVALDLSPAAARVTAEDHGVRLSDADLGSVTISACPKAQGDLVRGALRALPLTAADGRSWRADLDFQVAVVAVAGELRCGTEAAVGEDPGGGGGEPACPNTICADQAFACCPYRECLDGCEVTTCRAMACDDEPPVCRHRCRLACLEACAVAGGCVDAAERLWACQLDEGCYADGVAEDACTRESCCDAFTAAY